jgi:hypothetical protein
MVLLVIVATNCLAEYSRKRGMAKDLARKRESNKRLWLKRVLGGYGNSNSDTVHSFLVRSTTYLDKKTTLKTS